MNTPYKILFADQELPQHKDLLQELMNDERFQVKKLESNEQLTEEALNFAPQLIVFDTAWARTKSFEFVRQIKDSANTQLIPFLFLDETHQLKNLKEAFAHGAIDYIAKPYNLEEVFLRFEGHVTHYTLRAEPSKHRNDSRSLEHKLQQSRKLEAIGKLAGGIAHDFNNQLTGIMAGTDLIRMTMEEENEKLNRYLDMISRAADNAQSLAQSLLSFSQTSHEKKEHFLLKASLEHIINLLSKTIDRRIAISLDMDSDALIFGNETKLDNAFMNLLINASHAIDGKGTIHIRSRKVELAADDPTVLGFGLKSGEHVAISIQDNGCGISPDLMDHIFEPFFSTKGKGKGTGLGLAEVYATIKRHRGGIDVQSTLKRGTCFTLYLPLDGEDKIQNPASQSSAPEIQDISGKKILIIDDEMLSLRACQAMLGALEADSQIFQSPLKAIQHYLNQHQDYDLVIIDQMMPELTGPETLKELKKIKPDVKAILATGILHEDDKKWRDAGFSCLLQKPYRVQRLKESILSLY